MQALCLRLPSCEDENEGEDGFDVLDPWHVAFVAEEDGRVSDGARAGRPGSSLSHLVCSPHSEVH